MVDRTSLQKALEKYTPNVYYQPPSGYQMDYPCIVYRRSDIFTDYADNRNYMGKVEYTLTIMSKDADYDVPFRILEDIPMTIYENDLTYDNIYHTIIRVYH